MKGRKIAAASLLLLVWILISLFFKPDHFVTENEIRNYGEIYLQTFRNQVSQFKPDDQCYFPSFISFWNRTIDLKPMISDSHGAAIEFVVNASASRFHLVRTDERIEVAVFGGVFHEAHGLPFKIGHVRLILSLESGVNFIAGGQCMFEVFDNATLAVVGSDWTLDGVRYFNPLTVKGSNLYGSWTSGKATWDATFDFRYDLAYALNQSEGVREYVAYSELKGALSNIADSLKNDPDYEWTQLESDLNEVSRTASEKYGVTRPDFVEDVFDTIKEKTTLSKKLPVLSVSYDSNYTYTAFFSILLDLSYILAVSLNRLLGYLKKKLLTPLRKIAEQFGEWFTFIFVLVSFFVHAPFGYEWAIHIPILTIQLIALVFLLKATTKSKFVFQLNWRNVFYRLVFGTSLLLLVLAIVLLTIPVFRTLPSLFNSYFAMGGEFTVLSIAVATIGVVALLFSQIVCTRFLEHFLK